MTSITLENGNKVDATLPIEKFIDALINAGATNYELITLPSSLEKMRMDKINYDYGI